METTNMKSIENKKEITLRGGEHHQIQISK